jgi:hypothetical protein
MALGDQLFKLTCLYFTFSQAKFQQKTHRLFVRLPDIFSNSLREIVNSQGKVLASQLHIFKSYL